MENITVIIPLYNMEKYIDKCLNSVLSQTIKGLEVFVIDDGSTDKSMKIVKDYCKKYKNIKVYHQNNQGQAVAKNYGIMHATGKYVAIMDPDDYYPDEECLQKIYLCAEQHEALICAGYMMDDINGRICITDKDVKEKYYKNIFVDVNDYNDIYHHQRFLFRRDFLIEHKIYFPLYRRYEDPPFTIQALSAAKKFYAANIPVYVHRIGYKRIKQEINVCIDILQGICDVIKICHDNQYNKIYERVLKTIHRTYCTTFYKYAFNGYKEVDRLIMEINYLIKDWGKSEIEFVSEKDAKETRITSIQQFKEVIQVLTSNSNIILYGAGGLTYYFLDIFCEYKKNIIGIAVSDKKIEATLEEYKVQSINQFLDMCKEAIVLITTSEKYQDEIYETLIEKGFCNIMRIDVKKMELASALLEIR